LQSNIILFEIESGEVKLKFCKSEEQVSDIFINALPREKFKPLREALLIQEHHHVKEENVNVNMLES
jgi:hypothetical protein